MRRINDALGRFNSTLVYVRILSVTLGKDRHIHTVTLGKDRQVHIRIYACAHAWTLAMQGWQCQSTENEIETEETALERQRRLARERECCRLVEGEGFCCSLYKQPLMNKSEWELTNVNLSF